MRRSLGTSLRGIEVPSPGGVPLGVSAQTQDTKNEFEMIFRFFCVVSIEKTLPLFIGIVRVPVKRHPGESVLCRIWAQGARAGDPQIFSLERFSIQKLSPEPGQRKPRTPPTDASHAAGRVGGGRRPAAHAAAAPASVRGSLCGLRTRTRRGGDDGGARRVETRWRGAARGDNRAIVASPGSARTPSHIALQCADASFCFRARCRGGVEDAGGIELACTDAPDGAPPPWGTQRRTRHRHMTTVSSTSGGFHRRRRRCRLRGRQAAGRGTIFGAGCAAQRAASAPSPPHLHSTRAHSAPSCCGHELARA
jgi:hypothetical protein